MAGLDNTPPVYLYSCRSLLRGDEANLYGPRDGRGIFIVQRSEDICLERIDLINQPPKLLRAEEHPDE